MVQVDVFWTYGLGASFAVAGHRQLRHHMRQNASIYATKYFVGLSLFLLFLFIPSSVYMLWAFPSWQTMHVVEGDLPAWMATSFVVVNAALGLLGFRVAATLVRHGKDYAAFLQWVVGYFLMFFIVAYGWDGTGYQRYFSETRPDFMNWSWENASAWSNSDVAAAVNVFTVLMVPLLFYLLSGWINEGIAFESGTGKEAAGARSRWGTAGWIALLMLGFTLGTAVAAGLLVQWIGWAGLALAIVAIYLLCIRRGGLFWFAYRRVLAR